MDNLLRDAKIDGLDIQNISVRIMSAYQDFDGKLPGLTLSSINKSAKVPTTPSNPPTPYYLTLPCREYILTPGSNPFAQPNLNTMFTPEVLSKVQNRKEMEDIYWEIRLMYGCALLPLILIRLAKLLKKPKNGGHTFFTGKVSNSSSNEVKRLKIPFQNLSYRPFRFVPTSITSVIKRDITGHVRREQIQVTDFGYWAGEGYACHNVLVLNDEFIMDLSAMQFGLRGLNGELIMRPEPIESFKSRFPASDIQIPEKNQADEDYLLEGLNEMNQRVIEATAAVVLADILAGKIWCSYCGDGENGQEHKLCGRCRLAKYCEKYCQKSDWPGHKLFCEERQRMQ